MTAAVPEFSSRADARSFSSLDTDVEPTIVTGDNSSGRAVGWLIVASSSLLLWGAIIAAVVSIANIGR